MRRLADAWAGAVFLVSTSRFLDDLLGARCRCGQRVYPRDVPAHERDEHGGGL